jgi:hypothetical protein
VGVVDLVVPEPPVLGDVFRLENVVTDLEEPTVMDIYIQGQFRLSLGIE